MNLKPGKGRKFLFGSGNDKRMSSYYSPSINGGGTDLTDEPHLRSDFQREIGSTPVRIMGRTFKNLELALDFLAVHPKILASMEEMNRDIRNGNRTKYESRDYWHNTVINTIFNQAEEVAWARVSQKPNFQEVILAQRRSRIERATKQRDTSMINEVQPLLQFQPK